MADYISQHRVVINHPIKENQPFILTEGATCKHLSQVKRLKPGTQVVLVSTLTEQSYTANIEAISSKEIRFFVQEIMPQTPETLPHITLAAALIKGQRWDWLLQKATELGVREIQPLLTQHTVVAWHNGAHKLTRWKDITKNAVEQCDGRFLPVIHPPASLKEWLAAIEGFNRTTNLGLVLMERGSLRQTLLRTLQKARHPKKILVVIGPEGGLSDGEAHELIEAGFTSVQLGTRILRAETAAIASLSAIVAQYDTLVAS